MAGRRRVRVVFRGAKKLSSFTVKINGKKKLDRECDMKHESQSVECYTRVVYDIPLSCGRSYTGQPGRCVNTRLKQHKNSLKSREGSLSSHTNERRCQGHFSDTVIKARFGRQREREIWETFLIGKRGDRFVSAVSVGLSDREREFLRG